MELKVEDAVLVKAAAEDGRVDLEKVIEGLGFVDQGR